MSKSKKSNKSYKLEKSSYKLEKSSYKLEKSSPEKEEIISQSLTQFIKRADYYTLAQEDGRLTTIISRLLETSYELSSAQSSSESPYFSELVYSWKQNPEWKEGFHYTIVYPFVSIIFNHFINGRDITYIPDDIKEYLSQFTRRARDGRNLRRELLKLAFKKTFENLFTLNQNILRIGELQHRDTWFTDSGIFDKFIFSGLSMEIDLNAIKSGLKCPLRSYSLSLRVAQHFAVREMVFQELMVRPILITKYPYSAILVSPISWELEVLVPCCEMTYVKHFTMKLMDNEHNEERTYLFIVVNLTPLDESVLSIFNKDMSEKFSQELFATVSNEDTQSDLSPEEQYADAIEILSSDDHQIQHVGGRKKRRKTRKRNLRRKKRIRTKRNIHR